MYEETKKLNRMTKTIVSYSESFEVILDIDSHLISQPSQLPFHS